MIGGTRGARVRAAVNKLGQMDAQREVCKLKKQAVGGGYISYELMVGSHFPWKSLRGWLGGWEGTLMTLVGRLVRGLTSGGLLNLTAWHRIFWRWTI